VQRSSWGRREEARGHGGPIGPMTAAAAHADRLFGPSPRPSRPRRPARGQQRGVGGDLLQQMRRVARYLETAELLDLRASHTSNAALAAVLRERAAERRRVADRFRADLLDQRMAADRSRRRRASELWTPSARDDEGPGRR
jgi:hypothetical protein